MLFIPILSCALYLQEANDAYPLKVYQMHVTCNVSNRYAQTLVTSRVKNDASTAQEAAFSVVIPETAFITGFILEVDGKKYEAHVKEKTEAKDIYDKVYNRFINITSKMTN